MLVQFTVENYRSIKNAVTLSMVPTTAREMPQNIAEVPLVRKSKKTFALVKTAGLYGANASGKSNVLKALDVSRLFVIESVIRYDEGKQLPFVPFRLDVISSSQPSFFEFVVVIEDVLYRYGFSASREKVFSEWFYYSPKGRERLLFSRDGDNILTGPDFKQGESLLQHTRGNSLVVSSGSVLNNIFCKKLTSYFKKYVTYVPTSNDKTRDALDELLKDGNLDIMSDLVKFADLGIVSVQRKERDVVSMKKKLEKNIDAGRVVLNSKEKPLSPDMAIFLKNILTQSLDDESYVPFDYEFRHRTYSEGVPDGGYTVFPLQYESLGTVKYIALLAKAIRVLISGGVLIADELDASLHPKLTAGFFMLFNRVCSTQAQLIFSTHNTDLLDEDVLRRDQIWIVSKDKFASTVMTCLSDYAPRKDAVLGKRYIEGRFGGVPSLHAGYLEEASDKIRSHIASCSAVGGEVEHGN